MRGNAGSRKDRGTTRHSDPRTRACRGPVPPGRGGGPRLRNLKQLDATDRSTPLTGSLAVPAAPSCSGLGPLRLPFSCLLVGRARPGLCRGG